MSRPSRQQELCCGLAALWIGIAPHGAAAQSALTGTILSGASLSGSVRLVLGSRVASPLDSWTEIVLSDGSSIVLGPGAELVVRQIVSSPGSVRNRIIASGSGQIRIAAMDGTEVELATTGATVTVIAATAAVKAGPHGSVAMMGGREVVVARGSREDTLRRPGFSLPLDEAGIQRDSKEQIVAALAPFESSGPSRSSAETAPTPVPPTRAQRSRRGVTLAALAPVSSPTEVVAAGSTDLTTGLTVQSGSFTSSPALKVSGPTQAASTTSVVASTPTIVPVSPAAPNNSVPDLKISSYTNPPLAGGGAPNQSANTTPAPAPQPSFVAVDSVLLAGIPGTAGPITVPGTTTPVTAGLVPTNEHLIWGLFLPAGTSPTPTALASPGLTFQITSTALPAGSLQLLTGTATYAGGLIANNLATGGYRTGQFAQIWNFGTRSGALNAVFDGSTWQAIGLTMPSGTSGYAGSGTSTTDQRPIAVQGGFYNSTTVVPGSFPGASGGTFSVGPSSMGRPSAGGIFVGTRR